MIETSHHDEIEQTSELKFGAFMALVFLLVALWPAMDGGPPRDWALAATIGLLMVTVFFPRMLRPFNVAWFKLGMVLSTVAVPIVMGAIFLLAFVPTGVVMRLLGKDLLGLKPDREAETYWHFRAESETPASSMKNQF